MSKNRQCSSRESQQTVPVQDDARVEILLFLGIAFWCWMLVMFFQGSSSRQQQDPMILYWNGATLQMGTSDVAVPGQNKKTTVTPADMSPFLFQPIPVNFAGPELLTTISGIGAKMAEQIVKTRDAKGFFTKPQDLLTVPGIGPSRMQKFAPHLSFSVSQ